eukprot:m.17093 g.17093  ORF g.17093 m.17093 type:complete len:400 (-) comp7044_c0_seq1:180-1379(-)
MAMVDEPAHGEDSGRVVDLSSDDSLKVSIADALNEQDVVKFTVQTKTTLPKYGKRDASVTRLHEEFVWLHDRFEEAEAYAGFIIPPCPPKPDFSQSHGKLAKLQYGDASMPQDELERLKQEIQSEYLAAFQKTVAMHELFLQRLASHPAFREDDNLVTFLNYDKDLMAKSKSWREKVADSVKSAAKAIDSTFNTHIDPDPFFEEHRGFIVIYAPAIRDCAAKAEALTKKRLSLSTQYGGELTVLTHFAHASTRAAPMADSLRALADAFGKAQVIEKKLSVKEDLKLTDLLRYYASDVGAARALMCRRIKMEQDVDKATKALETAKKTGKKQIECQEALTTAQGKYEAISKTAREELLIFKKRRVAAFRRGLVQLAQVEIRQAREQYDLWKELLVTVRFD